MYIFRVCLDFDVIDCGIYLTHADLRCNEMGQNFYQIDWNHFNCFIVILRYHLKNPYMFCQSFVVVIVLLALHVQSSPYCLIKIYRLNIFR